jgi:predicted PurR-regulated permease PerM
VTPDFPETGPGSKKRRRWFLVTLALVTCLGLYIARDVLLPFLMAVVTAYVLSPLVNAGERLHYKGRHPRRWVVVLSLYTVLLGSATIGIVVSAPRLSAELGKLAREAPRLIREGRNEWIPALEAWLQKTSALYLKPFEAAGGVKVGGTTSPAQTGPRLDPGAVQIRPRGDGGYEVALPPQGLRVVPDGENAYRIMPAPQRTQAKGDLRAALDDVLGGALDSTERSAMSVFVAARTFVVKLSRGIFGFVLTLMLSAYLLITKDRIFEFFRQLYRPNRRGDFDDLLARIDRGLAGVVRGQLMICLINGVLSGIGFWLLDLKYWIFLTVLATVMSLIPIFGSILSTVPAVLIALPEGMTHALLVLGWIIAIHQLEANVLNPKVMGDAARVHPVLVVFALLAGEHFGGILGALLAVPVLSITQTVFLHLRERFLGVPRASTLPPPPMQTAASDAGT